MLTDNAEEIAPFVYLFDNVIDNAEELINAALKKKNSGNFDHARVFNVDGEQKINEAIRETERVDISPFYNNDVIWWLLAQKIWQYGNDYAVKNKINFSNMEPPQFLHYKKNIGFYNSHSDDDPLRVPRIISSVLYLNNVPEGGETYFEKFDISVKPKAGRMILFPSNFVYAHGAKVPISNDKFAVVTWFNP